MKYMLDKDILVYAKNKRPESVLKRLTSLEPEDVCISSVTLAKMEYGVFKSLMPKQNQLALMLFLSGIQIEPFDSKAAFEYGKIRAALTKKGTPIGANDLLIAAHAKSLDLILVTNNTREFERVEGLRLENWV